MEGACIVAGQQRQGLWFEHRHLVVVSSEGQNVFERVEAGSA